MTNQFYNRLLWLILNAVKTNKVVCQNVSYFNVICPITLDEPKAADINLLRVSLVVRTFTLLF